MPSAAHGAVAPTIRPIGPGFCTGIPLLAWAILLVVALVGTLSAQLPVARTSYLFPPGGRAGTSFEVTAGGSDLDEASGLHFSRAGISSTPKADAGKFTVTIASNVPPGIYETRVVGRFGISNPRAFVVGQWPEVIAPSTNTTQAVASELAVNTTIHSRIYPNTAAWYRLAAKKGQRLLIECLAEGIDSRMDATLALTDSEGRELERSRQGGLIDFTPAADGGYLLKVADFTYRGGDDYFYRLTASTGPRVDFVFPPAAVPGTKASFTFFGRNLPGGKPAKGVHIDGKPLDQLTVEIEVPKLASREADANGKTNATKATTRKPAATFAPQGATSLLPAAVVMDGFEYELKTPKGFANPVFISFASAPVVLELEPNNQPAQAQKVVPPCEVAGQFNPGNDADWFTFEAKKGDVFWVEAFSQRLGLPTDPFVVVQRVSKNDKGEEATSDVLELYDNDTNLGDREFNTTTRDPAARLEAKEAGTYRVEVRDLFNRVVASPRNVYRLSIRRETPDFQLVALTLAPKLKADAKNIDVGVPLLRRGETIAVRVLAFRRDGFNGDIRLSIENPPPGLIFEGDTIPAGQSSDYLLFTAAENAPAFAGPLKLVGRAQVGENELVREARGGTMVFPVGNTDSERPESRLTSEFALAICDKETAPISITTAERKTWEAPAGSKLTVPLTLTRRGDFNAKLKLKPLGPGPADALKEFEVEGNATNATLTLDLGALKLPAGEYAFAVQSQTTGKYRNNPEAADLAEAASKEAGKLASELTAAAKKASEELDPAIQSAAAAETAMKAAVEKFAAAKAAAEKAPTDEKLIADRAAAEKAAAEAKARSRTADEAKAAAEKTKASAEARAKEAQAKQEAAASRAKAAADRAKAREVCLIVHSTPIKVRVTAAEQAKSK